MNTIETASSITSFIYEHGTTVWSVGRRVVQLGIAAQRSGLDLWNNPVIQVSIRVSQWTTTFFFLKKRHDSHLDSSPSSSPDPSRLLPAEPEGHVFSAVPVSKQQLTLYGIADSITLFKGAGQIAMGLLSYSVGATNYASIPTKLFALTQGADVLSGGSRVSGNYFEAQAFVEATSQTTVVLEDSKSLHLRKIRYLRDGCATLYPTLWLANYLVPDVSMLSEATNATGWLSIALTTIFVAGTGYKLALKRGYLRREHFFSTKEKAL